MDTPTPRRRSSSPIFSPTGPTATLKSDPITELGPPVEMLLPLSPSASASCTTSPPVLSDIRDPLTPPTTPEKPADERSSIKDVDGGLEALIDPLGCRSQNIPLWDKVREQKELHGRQKALDRVPNEPQTYCKKYQIDKELGQGAWSNVYCAFERSQGAINLAMFPPSPPVSPESKLQEPQGKVLAVKIPSEKAAYQILKKEACILTYLHTYDQAKSFLAPFHGFETSTRAIVMDAIPSNLEAFMKSNSKGGFTTKTMFDPIVGAKNWASLAKQLIDGLAFLQSRHCIHGDIKPANILLQSDEISDTLIPLYCDFSSSRVESIDVAGEIEEITAVTKDFLSPELLNSLLGRNGERAIATFASDVFALGVTLIAAAIGSSPYASAQVEIQKLSMAKEGMPIDFARQGDNGSRIMKGRAVAKIVGPAVERNPEKRISVSAWGRLTDEVLKRWDKCGWVNGG